MRLSLAASLIIVLLVCSQASALMLGYVDGHNVHYSPGKAYAVDPSFQYLGSFTRESGSKDINSIKQATKVLHHEVFGKLNPETGEVVELFIARWDKLPSGWNYLPKGEQQERFYPFNVNRFTGLPEFLTSKGFTAAKAFHGGVLKGYNESNVSTTYFFAVAYGVIPPNVEENEYVRRRFSESVK